MLPPIDTNGWHNQVLLPRGCYHERLPAGATTSRCQQMLPLVATRGCYHERLPAGATTKDCQRVLLLVATSGCYP